MDGGRPGGFQPLKPLGGGGGGHDGGDGGRRFGGLRPQAPQHQTGLMPSLLAMFDPRSPVNHSAPMKKRKPALGYTGIAAHMGDFTSPGEDEYAPPKVHVETRDEKEARRRQAFKEKGEHYLQEGMATWDPNKDPKIEGDPYKTLFVGRLSYEVTESKLRREFEQYGPIKRIRLVHDTNTDKPRGYAFLEFHSQRDMKNAYKNADGRKVENRRVVVDVERGRTVPNWRPRRLAGGLGGTRMGGKDRNVVVSGRDLGTSIPDDPNRPKEEPRDRERDEKDRRDREREREREREGHRDRDRKEKEDRDRRDKERAPDRPREERPRDDRPREERPREERPRERERDRDRDRERDRERDRDKDRNRDRSREKDRDRREKDRHRDRSRDKDGKERDRDRDRKSGGDRSRERDRGDRDRHASREAGEIEPGEVPLPPPPMPGGVVGEVPMGGALPPPPGATGYPPPYDGAGSGGGYEQA